MSISIANINRYGREGSSLITNVEVVTAPSVDAVSASDVLEYLRIDTGDTSQSAVIAVLTKDAIHDVQKEANVSLITQTLRTTFSYGQVVTLPYGPVISITSVESQSTADGSWSATTDYVNMGAGVVTFTVAGIYRVTYTAGFGTASTNVPENYRSGLLRHVCDHFEMRNGISIDATAQKIDGLSWRDVIQPAKKYSI